MTSNYRRYDPRLKNLVAESGDIGYRAVDDSIGKSKNKSNKMDPTK
jgi:hypothetical protein